MFQKEFYFLNYGYFSENEEISIQLFPEDETQRDFINLYHHVVKDLDLNAKELVEIGCGRGGGSHYFSKYFQPKSVLGIDFSKMAIQFCQTHHHQDRLSFQEGDAENLPLSNDSCDVVVNVESSHCYGSMEKFVQEVFRVLRRGGYFTWADIRQASEEEKIKKLLEAQGFQILKKENITSPVLRSLDRTHEIKSKMIHEHVFFLFQKALRSFAGVKQTPIYEGFKKGELVYLHFLLQKPSRK